MNHFIAVPVDVGATEYRRNQWCIRYHGAAGVKADYIIRLHPSIAGPDTFQYHVCSNHVPANAAQGS